MALNKQGFKGEKLDLTAFGDLIVDSSGKIKRKRKRRRRRRRSDRSIRSSGSRRFSSFSLKEYVEWSRVEGAC